MDNIPEKELDEIFNRIKKDVDLDKVKDKKSLEKQLSLNEKSREEHGKSSKNVGSKLQKKIVRETNKRKDIDFENRKGLAVDVAKSQKESVELGRTKNRVVSVQYMKNGNTRTVANKVNNDGSRGVIVKLTKNIIRAISSVYEVEF